jgi:hypothetical protein
MLGYRERKKLNRRPASAHWALEFIEHRGIVAINVSEPELLHELTYPATQREEEGGILKPWKGSTSFRHISGLVILSHRVDQKFAKLSFDHSSNHVFLTINPDHVARLKVAEPTLGLSASKCKNRRHRDWHERRSAHNRWRC